MPWLAVEKAYVFEGPGGTASLADVFDGRRQLIVYRAFFEPGVFGWPDHACRGCSMVADQVAHLAHLNARDTTLVFASRASQADIGRLKARMGWTMPWVTITDAFDGRFRRGSVARHQRLHPRRRPDLPDLFRQQSRRRSDGKHLELPRPDRARTAGGLGGFAGATIRRPPRTNGGTGTTPTPPRPRPTKKWGGGVGRGRKGVPEPRRRVMAGAEP